MNGRDSSILSIGAAFLIGGLIGAGAMLLMAPQSGKETRALIRDKSVGIKDRAVDTAGQTRARAGKAIGSLTHQTKETASKAASRLSDRGKDMVEMGKEKASAAVQAAKRS